METRQRVIAVQFKTSAQPSKSVGFSPERDLGHADPYQPPMRIGVARRKPKRFVDVCFGDAYVPPIHLSRADESLGSLRHASAHDGVQDLCVSGARRSTAYPMIGKERGHVRRVRPVEQGGRKSVMLNQR